jgi:uncharacterized membrane protein
MSKTWKWIIGIIVALLVLGAVFSVPFMMHNRFGSQAAFENRGNGFEGGYGPGGMMGRFDNDGYGPGGYNRGGMMGRGSGFAHPMMYGFGFFPFGMFMWIIPLAILGLAIYGFIALIRRRPTGAPAAEVAPAAPTQSCANCGKPAQSDWKTCPYCGNSL